MKGTETVGRPFNPSPSDLQIMTLLTTQNPPIGECPTFRQAAVAPLRLASQLFPSAREAKPAHESACSASVWIPIGHSFRVCWIGLNGYQDSDHRQFAELGGEVVDAGIVDNPLKSHEAADRFRREGVDIVFLNVSTYALSSTVLPVVQTVAARRRVEFAAGVEARLCGVQRLGRSRSHDRRVARTLPGMFGPGNRLRLSSRGHRFPPGDRLSRRSDRLEGDRRLGGSRQGSQGDAENRVGVLGHYYCGMLDVYSDLTQQSAVFGNHFELLEMCELRQLRDRVTPEQIQAKLRQFADEFAVDPAMPGRRIGAGSQDLLRSGRLGREASARFDGLLLRKHQRQRV